MTVTNIWNAFGNWTPFSEVCVYRVSTAFSAEYSYFEDVIKDWGDSIITHFNLDASTDTVTIMVK